MPVGLERRGFLVVVAGAPMLVALLQGCAAQEEEDTPDSWLDTASILQLERLLEGRLGVYAFNAANGVSVAYREQDRFALDSAQARSFFRKTLTEEEVSADSAQEAGTSPRALLETLLRLAPAGPASGLPAWRQRLREHGNTRRQLGDAVPQDWPVVMHAAQHGGSAYRAVLVFPPGRPAVGAVAMAEAQTAKSRNDILVAAVRQSLRMLGLS